LLISISFLAWFQFVRDFVCFLHVKQKYPARHTPSMPVFPGLLSEFPDTAVYYLPLSDLLLLDAGQHFRYSGSRM
jgi:hypothetical protein